VFTSIKYFQKLRKKYGKIFRFWAGPKPIIVICDPKVVREILVNTRVFPKTKDYIKTFGPGGFGNGLVTSSNEIHRKDRARFSRFFTPNYLLQKVPRFNRQIKSAIEQILVPHLNTPFDVQHFFHTTALRIFGEHALTLDFSSRPEQTEWAIGYCKLGSKVIGDLMMQGLPHSCLFPKVRKLNSELKIWHGILNAEIEKRKQLLSDPLSPKIDDCLTTMIEDQMPLQDMLDHITTLCAAGHDTTAFLGCYLAYSLALNQEVQKKAKEEIHAVLSGREELSADDIQTLLNGYMGLVIQETLRLYSVIPFIKREASENTSIKLDGDNQTLEIPKGVEIVIPICLMNRDRDIWQDPNKFLPERWTGILSQPIKHGFFSFSYGSRSCIGMQMAKIEMVAMIGMILNEYSFFCC